MGVLDNTGLQRLWSHIQAGFGDLQAQINNLSIVGDYVPLTRKINNKELSEDINLSAEDVGALTGEEKLIFSKKTATTQNFTKEDDIAGWYQLASFKNFNTGVLLLEAQGWWEETLYIFYGVNYTNADVNSPGLTIIGNTLSTCISQFRINYISDFDTYYLEAYITPSIEASNGSHNLFLSNIFTNHTTTSWGSASSFTILPKTLSAAEGIIYAVLSHGVYNGVNTTGNIRGRNLVVGDKSYGETLPGIAVEGQVYFKKVT